jgi:hypothetical protein
MKFSDNRNIFGLIVLLTVAACQEPEGIGLEVLPDGEEMPIAWIDTFTVQGRTVLYDSVQTSGTNSGTYLIGDFGDPIFGRVRSELFTQYKLPTTDVDFGSGATIDSIVLNLAYVGSYGNTSKLMGTMKFGVYELTEDLYSTASGDSTYYSTATHTTSATPLAEIEFRPDLYSRIPTIIDTVPPSLRIPLDPDLGQRILNSGNLASNEVFLEEFKGLNVRPINTYMADDFGSILYFNMPSTYSRVELYYSGGDGDSTFVLEIKNSYGVHTSFSHDFSAEILTAIDDSTVAGESNLYVQSMAGLRMKLEFPFLKELNQLGVVAISKAELVVPIDETVNTSYSYPSSLQITGINEDGGPVFLVDFFEGSDYFGGTYDSENQQYVFNIARHLQSILNNPEEPDYGLYISNSGNAVNGRRAVFHGTGHPSRAVKLRMTYTIIE